MKTLTGTENQITFAKDIRNTVLSGIPVQNIKPIYYMIDRKEREIKKLNGKIKNDPENDRTENRLKMAGIIETNLKNLKALLTAVENQTESKWFIENRDIILSAASGNIDDILLVKNIL